MNAGREAVIFGAGNIGRGFIGQLFSESGYTPVFVDISRPLVAALQSERAYTIRLVDGSQVEQVRVSPVWALAADDLERVAEALAGASLGATAVGARALPQVAPSLARGISLRAALGVQEPLNIIVCENLVDAAATLRSLVSQYLSDEQRAYLDSHVGFVEAVIGRMIPQLPPEVAEREPTLVVAEPFKELPVDRAAFVGEIPSVVGMQAVEEFDLYVARKLYLHNAGHAVLGYLGYQKGFTYAYEALEDEQIGAILDGAFDEALRGIVAVYGASEGWLREHVADLKRRFANRALGDPIVRLARDPLRKLAPEDRLVGAARVAERAGMVPVNLSWGIAGALAYDEPSDAMAEALQRQIAEQGVQNVLATVSRIHPDEALGVAVLTRYRILSQGEPWP